MRGGVEGEFGGENEGVEIATAGCLEGGGEGVDVLFCSLLLSSVVVVGKFGCFLMDLKKKKNQKHDTK